mmetsp:Transcript_13006/g.18224  ORF Transcript_13006/g.18224 Transcript_13006/m.18224 type:complete len:904 (+) Transcript_13006:275-2986(+)
MSKSRLVEKYRQYIPPGVTDNELEDLIKKFNGDDGKIHPALSQLWDDPAANVEWVVRDKKSKKKHHQQQNNGELSNEKNQPGNGSWSQPHFTPSSKGERSQNKLKTSNTSDKSFPRTREDQSNSLGSGQINKNQKIKHANGKPQSKKMNSSSEKPLSSIASNEKNQPSKIADGSPNKVSETASANAKNEILNGPQSSIPSQSIRSWANAVTLGKAPKSSFNEQNETAKPAERQKYNSPPKIKKESNRNVQKRKPKENDSIKLANVINPQTNVPSSENTKESENSNNGRRWEETTRPAANEATIPSTVQEINQIDIKSCEEIEKDIPCEPSNDLTTDNLNNQDHILGGQNAINLSEEAPLPKLQSSLPTTPSAGSPTASSMEAVFSSPLPHSLSISESPLPEKGKHPQEGLKMGKWDEYFSRVVDDTGLSFSFGSLNIYNSEGNEENSKLQSMEAVTAQQTVPNDSPKQNEDTKREWDSSESKALPENIAWTEKAVEREGSIETSPFRFTSQPAPSSLPQEPLSMQPNLSKSLPPGFETPLPSSASDKSPSIGGGSSQAGPPPGLPPLTKTSQEIESDRSHGSVSQLGSIHAPIHGNKSQMMEPQVKSKHTPPAKPRTPTIQEHKKDQRPSPAEFYKPHHVDLNAGYNQQQQQQGNSNPISTASRSANYNQAPSMPAIHSVGYGMPPPGISQQAYAGYSQNYGMYPGYQSAPYYYPQHHQQYPGSTGYSQQAGARGVYHNGMAPRGYPSDFGPSGVMGYPMEHYPSPSYGTAGPEYGMGHPHQQQQGGSQGLDKNHRHGQVPAGSYGSNASYGENSGGASQHISHPSWPQHGYGNSNIAGGHHQMQPASQSGQNSAGWAMNPIPQAQNIQGQYQHQQQQSSQSNSAGHYSQYSSGPSADNWGRN